MSQLSLPIDSTVKADIVEALELMGITLAPKAVTQRTPKELYALLASVAEKWGGKIPNRVMEAALGPVAVTPEKVVAPVTEESLTVDVADNVALYDQVTEVIAETPAARPALTAEEKKNIKRNTKALEAMGLYRPRHVLLLNTEYKSAQWSVYDSLTRKKEWVDIASLGSTGKYLKDSFFYWDRAVVVETSSGFTSMDHLQEELGLEKTKAGYTEFVSIQQTLKAPGVMSVPNDDGPPTEMLSFGVLGSEDQRSAAIVDRVADLGYAIYGGSGGGVKAAVRTQELPKDPKVGSLFKRIIKALSKGVEWTGYLSKFNATVHETFTNVTVGYYDASTNRGEDGASWGLNIDHPGNAGLVEAHGTSCLQFFYGNEEGVYGKGILLPWNGGVDGPQFRLAHNAVKGRMKSIISKEIKEGVVRIDTVDNFIGILRASDHHKTQQLGFQWLLHCANTAENRAIVKEAAEKTTREIVNGGIESIIDKVCAQDATAEIARQFAKKLGKNPMSIPVIQNRVLAKLRKGLFEAFASIGVEGQIFELAMDDRQEPGTFSCDKFPKGSKAASPSVGDLAAVWRTPHMHRQGNLLLTRAALRDDQMVMVDGNLVPIRGVIFMHPADVAKIQGDDDGDTVAVSSDPIVVELAANHRDYHLDNKVWSFEPESHATGKEFPDKTAFHDARHRDQGPVGLAVNWQAEALGIRDIHGERIALAFGAIGQGCVDQLKKTVEVASFEALSTMDFWEKKEAVPYNIAKAPKAKAMDEEILKELFAPRNVSKALSEGAEFLNGLKAEMGKKVKNLMIQNTIAWEKDQLLTAQNEGWAQDEIDALKKKIHAAWSHKKNKDGVFERSVPKAWIAKIAKPAKKWGKADFAAWKWHGHGSKKGEVNPVAWLPCKEKDGGYQHLRNKDPKTAISPTLVHHAHDAAQAIWVKEGAAIIEQLKLVDSEGFVSFAKLFKDVAKVTDDGAALPKDVADAKKWWAETPPTMKPLYKKENGKLVVDMRGSGMVTHLERNFEEEMSKLIAAQRTQAEYLGTLGGDGDNGKGAQMASNGFHQWVLGMRERGDRDSKGNKRPPRPLTAKECLYLAVYHELGATVEGNLLTDPVKDPVKAAKEKARRGRNAWNFLFSGSPLAEALGCRIDSCDALGLPQVKDVMASYSDGKSFKSHIWLDLAANRELVVDDLDGLHQKHTGIPLTACKACTMRVKTSLAEFMIDTDRRDALIALANKLNERAEERVSVASKRLIPDWPRSQVWAMNPKELADTLAELGVKVTMAVNQKGTDKQHGMKNLYVSLAPIMEGVIPDYQDFEVTTLVEEDVGELITLDDLE